MRGKGIMQQPKTTDNRITPRLCGEKFTITENISYQQGSPPPMRGKAVLTAGAWQSRGITPAYAGKSHLLRMCQGGREDHPRLCGEKACSMCQTAMC